MLNNLKTWLKLIALWSAVYVAMGIVAVMVLMSVLADMGFRWGTLA